MNLKELFEKIYNDEIKEENVIVEHIQDYDEEYDNYILNDGFDFWDINGIKSLSFFKNDNTEKYKTIYSIISKEEYDEIVEEKEKQEKIQRLKNELKKLEGE